jgi:hypothetical protein
MQPVRSAALSFAYIVEEKFASEYHTRYEKGEPPFSGDSPQFLSCLSKRLHYRQNHIKFLIAFDTGRQNPARNKPGRGICL